MLTPPLVHPDSFYGSEKQCVYCKSVLPISWTTSCPNCAGHEFKILPQKNHTVIAGTTCSTTIGPIYTYAGQVNKFT
jgi:hypothetical protein